MKHYAIIEKDILKQQEFNNTNKELKLLYLLLSLNADYNGYIDNANELLKEYDFNKDQLNELVKQNIILKSPYLKNLYIDKFNPLNKKTTQKRLYSQYDNLHRNLFIDNRGVYYFENSTEKTNNTKLIRFDNAIENMNKEIIENKDKKAFSNNKNVDAFIEWLIFICNIEKTTLTEQLQRCKDTNNLNYKPHTKTEKAEIDNIINELVNKYETLDQIISIYNLD